MERRPKRLSAAQWDMALDFFERHPSLIRGYHNSAKARELSHRLWQELADILNAEGSGATKTAKEWATYFNNFKSKLKKTVSDLNKDSTATGGGPPQAQNLTEVEQRFLAVMGSGFGQGAPNVRVNPFPNVGSSTERRQNEAQNEVQNEVQNEAPVTPEDHDSRIVIVQQEIAQEVEIEDVEAGSPQPSTSTSGVPAEVEVPPPRSNPAEVEVPLPRRSRRTRRYHTRPMAPIDEARRILTQVEMQRAAADQEQARALLLIGQNLGRLADAAERYLGILNNIQ